MTDNADMVQRNLDDQLAVTRRNINVHSYGVIRGIMGSRVVDSLPLRLRCECSVPSCEEIIEVLLSQRRELRRKFPRGFIIVIRHLNSLNDNILHKEDLLGVVEKPGFAQPVIDL